MAEERVAEADPIHDHAEGRRGRVRELPCSKKNVRHAGQGSHDTSDEIVVLELEDAEARERALRSEPDPEPDCPLEVPLEACRHHADPYRRGDFEENLQDLPDRPGLEADGNPPAR